MLDRWRSLVFWLLLLLAGLLRFHNYAQFPIVGETADEFAWTMLGASLIETGTPTSWSNFDVYREYWITEERSFDIGTGQKYPLVQPVFDHPPLFSFLPGLAQSIRGSWDQPASAKVMRLPMIGLGVINVALVYLVSKKLFSKSWLSFLPMAIYATAPLFVFSSRLAVAENLLTTWVLATILILLTKIAKDKQFWLLSLISALAVLTKMAGLIVPGSLLIYGLTQRNAIWKAGLLGGAIGLAIFFLYGVWYDWQLFIQVFADQANRGFGFLTLHNRLFLHPAVVRKYFIDGWLISGLVATAVILYDNPKKWLPVSLFFLSNLLFILFFVDEQTLYGWYDYPFFPLFSLFLAYVLSRIWTEKKYLLFSLFWLLLLPVFKYGLSSLKIYYQAIELSPWIGRAFIGLGFLPWLLSVSAWQPRTNWPQKIIIFLGLAILAINIVTTLTFSQNQYWNADEYLMYRGFIYPDTLPIK